ncbi:MAG: hypothetical protein WBP45_12985 [Daejeonella sp.]
MKQLILLLISTTLSSLSLAQNSPDPEFPGRPYILLQNNILESIERSDGNIDVKMPGIGYSGSETYYSAYNPKSSTRLSKNLIPKFIIKLDGANTDPKDVLLLSKGISKKDRRQFLRFKMTMGGKSIDVSSSFVKLEFKKVKDGIYEILLPESIEIGEYAFMQIISSNDFAAYSTTIKLSCFGIDL